MDQGRRHFSQLGSSTAWSRCEWLKTTASTCLVSNGRIFVDCVPIPGDGPGTNGTEQQFSR